MGESNSNRALVILVLAVAVSAVAALAAVLVAVQRPVVVVVNQPGAAVPTGGGTGPPAVALASATPTAAALPGAPAAAPAPAPVAISAVRVASVPGPDDPLAATWDSVPAAEIDLLPQQVASPMLETATIRKLRVQAAHDDGRVAWRLSWDAQRPSTSVETGVFGDAVALQLPLADGTPFTMGAKGKPVRVLQWKAVWQKDIDEGFQDVETLYPNARNDMYWGATGTFPYKVTEAFASEDAKQRLVGVAAGSPMSELHRKQPVEELAAEGFGTTTHVPDSLSKARGQWKDGRWTVVIDRPLTEIDPLNAALKPGKTGQISFAVWDGAAGNVGGRKHYVGWVPFSLEP